MQKILISDLSEGIRGSELLFGPHSSAVELAGLDHRAGRLSVLASKKQLALADNPLTAERNTAWTNLGEYYSETGELMVLGHKGRHNWIGMDSHAYRRLLRQEIQFDFELNDPQGMPLRNRSVSGANGVNHGTVATPLWSGSVRWFDGNSYIGTSQAIAQDMFGFSCSFWFRVPAWFDAGSGIIVSNENNNGPGAIPFTTIHVIDGKLQCVIKYPDASTVSITSDNVVADDTWHYGAVTYQPGANPILYIDGGVPGGVVAGVPQNNSRGFGPAMIGGIPDAWGSSIYTRHLIGWMGSISVYDPVGVGVLTPAEIEAQYTHEKPRYGDPQEVPIKFYPLLGGTFRNAQKHIKSRSTPAFESFVQAGRYLYMSSDAPGPGDWLYRWDGMLLYESVARVLPGNIMNIQYVNPFKYGVQSGDTVYFKVFDANMNTFVWDIENGRQIHSIDPMTQLITLMAPSYDTIGLGPGGGDFVEYCIVRTHRAGVEAGSQCFVASSGGAPSGATGNFVYTWRYRNSQTGYSGTMAIPSSPYVMDGTTTAAPTISGWIAQPDDLDVDAVEIFVSHNAGPFYRLHTITRPLHERANFPINFTQAGTGSGPVIDPDADMHDRPGALRAITLFNSRLYAQGTSELPHWLMYSSLNAFEYFPGTQWGSTIVSPLRNVGGRVRVGATPGEPILGMVPELGAYASSGLVGANLLIACATRCFRFFGLTQDDFNLQSAFHEGVVSGQALMNAGGRIVFVSEHHIHVLDPGSNTPTPIDTTLFPTGLPGNRQSLSRWTCAYWQGWYLFCANDGGANNRLLMYDPSRGTWTSTNDAFNHILALSDPRVYSLLGADVDPVMSGGFPVTSISAGFAATSARTFAYSSGALYLDVKQEDMHSEKHLKQLIICCRCASAQVTLNVAIRTMGDTSIPPATTKTVVIPAATATKNRHIARVGIDSGTPHSAILSVRISGTAPKPFALEWLQVGYDIAGGAFK